MCSFVEKADEMFYRRLKFSIIVTCSTILRNRNKAVDSYHNENSGNRLEKINTNRDLNLICVFVSCKVILAISFIPGKTNSGRMNAFSFFEKY